MRAGMGKDARMALNLHIDDAIYKLQSQGGISRLWRSLTPPLQTALPEAQWDGAAHADVYLPTYYGIPENGARSVVMVYDFIAETYPPIGRYHIDAVQKRAAIARADKVVAISKFVADDCMRFTGKPAEVAYCGGGETFTRALPDAVAAFKAQHNIERPYVLVVGRRGLYKNVQTLYQAWPFWSGRDSHLILAIGGEEPGAAETTFANRYSGQWRQLRLDDATLATAYTGAAALVYPSFHEGFGLPIVEAMTCGCPVICGTAGSLPEVAGQAAYYADVFRPQSIAAALDAVVSNPGLRLERVMAGYQQAKQFTWSTMADVVADSIREVA